MGIQHESMKKIPNRITVSRIILIFLFVVLANFDGGPDPNPNCIIVNAKFAYVCHVIAYILAIIAGLTDFLDGHLARKYHVESDFGRLIDPLADKIFLLATYIMMVDYRLVPAWILIVMLAREFMVTGLRTLASAKGIVIAADKFGKIKTVLQMLALFIGGASWLHLFGFNVLDKGSWMYAAWYILLILVALVTVASGLSYFIRYRKLYFDSTL